VITVYSAANRLRFHQQAKEEPAAFSSVISLACDVAAAPYRRTGCDHRLRCRKSQQHWQTSLLSGAMRWQHHAIVPDVVIDFVAPLTVLRKSHLQLL